MAFFGKKIGKNGKTVASEQVGQFQRRDFTAHMAVSVTTTDGYFHMEPPKEDFDAVTHQANPWELTGTNINGKLYICNPTATMDPDTGRLQDFEANSQLLFRVANDSRNPQNMIGSFCRSSGQIRDTRFSVPAYDLQQMPSINQQKLNASDPTPGPNHQYCVKTANSIYTITAQKNYGSDSVDWYLNGGSDRQMFANVPIENPFDTKFYNPDTGVLEQHVLGQEPKAHFMIKSTDAVPDGYKNRTFSTSSIQSIVDYDTSIGVACDVHTRQEVDYPLEMRTYATKDGKAFIGTKSDYDNMMNAPIFNVEQSAQSINRVKSEVSRPGIMVTTMSGSEYGFEPTRNPDLWHMIDFKRGGTWDIAPIDKTYETINAGHKLRGEQPEIIGEGSVVHFEVLINSPNNTNCPLKLGANHTSKALHVTPYEPKWMERERMANSGVEDLQSQTFESNYNFAD